MPRRPRRDRGVSFSRYRSSDASRAQRAAHRAIVLLSSSSLLLLLLSLPSVLRSGKTELGTAPSVQRVARGEIRDLVSGHWSVPRSERCQWHRVRFFLFRISCGNLLRVSSMRNSNATGQDRTSDCLLTYAISSRKTISMGSIEINYNFTARAYKCTLCLYMHGDEPGSRQSLYPSDGCRFYFNSWQSWTREEC